MQHNFEGEVTIDRLTDYAIARHAQIEMRLSGGDMIGFTEEEVAACKKEMSAMKHGMTDPIALFMAVFPETKDEIYEAIRKELSELEGKNGWPFQHYADRNDEFSQDDMAKLFDCKTVEQVYEWYNEREESIRENCWDWEARCEYEWLSERLVEALDDYFEENIKDYVNDSEAVGYLREFLQDHGAMYWDYSDVVENCMRNTTTHILAYPMDKNGELYEGPHYGYSKADNSKIARKLMRKFGCKKEHVDAVYIGYECARLVLCGTIDANDWYDYVVKNNKVPDTVTIHPGDSDNLYFHDWWNGSCSDGTLVVTKPTKCRARFELDGAHGYGMDQICGFTGEFWRRCEISFS